MEINLWLLYERNDDAAVVYRMSVVRASRGAAWWVVVLCGEGRREMRRQGMVVGPRLVNETGRRRVGAEISSRQRESTCQASFMPCACPPFGGDDGDGDDASACARALSAPRRRGGAFAHFRHRCCRC